MTQTHDDTMFEGYDFGQSMGAEAAKAARAGGDFERELMFLTLDASPAGVQQGKDRAILRIVTDATIRPDQPVSRYNLPWITASQHFHQTKQKPPYSKPDAQWPPKWSGGCRKDKIFSAKYNGQCLLCDQGSKASPRTWALAVEREQVIENNQIVGIRDKQREVLVIGPDDKAVITGKDADGKDVYAKKTVPAYLVLNFGWKNFFGNLNGQAQYFGTVQDSDYVVTRTGMGNNDTTYSFVRLDPIILPEGNPWGLPAGTKYDLSLPGFKEALYPEMPDLRGIVAERVSDDYLGRWFVPGWLPKDFDPSQVQGGGQQVQQGVATGPQQGYIAPPPAQFQGASQQPATPQPAAATAAAPSNAALDALRARLGGGSNPAEQPAEAAQPAQPAQPAQQG